MRSRGNPIKIRPEFISLSALALAACAGDSAERPIVARGEPATPRTGAQGPDAPSPASTATPKGGRPQTGTGGNGGNSGPTGPTGPIAGGSTPTPTPQLEAPTGTPSCAPSEFSARVGSPITTSCSGVTGGPSLAYQLLPQNGTDAACPTIAADGSFTGVIGSADLCQFKVKACSSPSLCTPESATFTIAGYDFEMTFSGGALSLNADAMNVGQCTAAVSGSISTPPSGNLSALAYGASLDGATFSNFAANNLGISFRVPANQAAISNLTARWSTQASLQGIGAPVNLGESTRTGLAIARGSDLNTVDFTSTFLKARTSGPDLLKGARQGRQLPGSGCESDAGCYDLGNGPGMVSAGHTTTCALRADQSAVCWGSNSTGELGNGTTSSNGTPVTVGLPNGVAPKVIHASKFTNLFSTPSGCAVAANNDLHCWGNDSDKIFSGSAMANATQPTPIKVIDAAVDGISVADVGVGSGYMCVLTTGGAVHCWGGSNLANGVLGDNTSTVRLKADKTKFVGNMTLGFMSSGVKRLSVGPLTACALMETDGSVRCWGNNTYSQVGTTAASPIMTPVALEASMGMTLTGATDVAIGDAFACVLMNDESVKCWGSSNYGKTSRSASGSNNFPNQILGLGAGSGAVSLTLGREHGCVLIKDGSVKCWGRNTMGQLGRDWSDTANRLRNSDTALTVHSSVLPEKALAISAGIAHTCALTVSGKVRCWGANNQRQIGDLSISNTHTPTAMETTSLSDVTTIAVDAAGSCAAGSMGLRCWGDYGPLQGYNDENVNRSVVAPYVLSTGNHGTNTYTQMEISIQHACARTNTGKAYCWGANTGEGRLGNTGASFYHGAGVFVHYDNDGIGPMTTTSELTGVTKVAVGETHSCAVAGGAAYCWGNGGNGRLGHNDATPTANKSVGVVVSGLSSGVTDIAAGINHTCAVVSGGVKCWGSNANGQLGTNNQTSSNIPVDVSGLTGASNVVKVYAGNAFSCALVRTAMNDTLKCWGNTADGQVGGGVGTGNQLTPANVTGFTNLDVNAIGHVALGSGFACAFKTDAAVSTNTGLYCWGNNDSGELGIGTTSDEVTTPQKVTGLSSSVTTFAVGDSGCALDAGTMKCWGRRDRGQWGDVRTHLGADVVDLTGSGTLLALVQKCIKLILQ